MVEADLSKRRVKLLRKRRFNRKSFSYRKLCWLVCLLGIGIGIFILGYRLVGGFLLTIKRIKVPHTVTSYDSPLIIFTFERPQYLSKTLEDVYNYIPRPCGFGCPIVVSEDGYHDDIKAVVSQYQKKFKAEGIPLVHIHHSQASSGEERGAYKMLAKHYFWGLKQIFHGKIGYPKPERVIILEEDIHIAPDFFSYMAATSKILDQDPSLYAVSAFNDNGHMAMDPKRILRSDFFPGLGWMMTKSLWLDELESKWPAAYWDDWLRDPAQRKGRQVIRPEYSRTYHFGFEGGASNNQFGYILEHIRLCDQYIDWSKEDLSYLEQSAYDKWYTQLVEKTQTVDTMKEAKSMLKSKQDVVIKYQDLYDFQQIAWKIDIMDDEKANVPRTAYKGIVEVRPFDGALFFLKPASEKTY